MVKVLVMTVHTPLMLCYYLIQGLRVPSKFRKKLLSSCDVSKLIVIAMLVFTWEIWHVFYHTTRTTSFRTISSVGILTWTPTTLEVVRRYVFLSTVLRIYLKFYSQGREISCFWCIAPSKRCHLTNTTKLSSKLLPKAKKINL